MALFSFHCAKPIIKTHEFLAQAADYDALLNAYARPITAETMAKMELREMLGESDFVSLHPPLTPDTRKTINDETLARMKPNAVLVNCARGRIVDTEALVRVAEPLRRSSGHAQDRAGWVNEIFLKLGDQRRKR